MNNTICSYFIMSIEETIDLIQTLENKTFSNMSIEKIINSIQLLYNHISAAEFSVTMMQKEIIMQQNILMNQQKLIADKRNALQNFQNQLRELGVNDPILLPIDNECIVIENKTCISENN